jgi:chromosome segregation ATPase
LEEKIKAYDETSVTSSESMTDLKREVSRFKDSESLSGKYIIDLEARLARSDESVLALQQTIEQLEKEVDRRRDHAAVLQSQLDSITRDGESWRSDLEERERKVLELEAKMAEWEHKRLEAAEDRLRIGIVVGEVAVARKSIEAINGITPNGSDHVPSGAQTPANQADLSLESQLVALQQTHTATLADLSSVTAKYRDALREITDLASQIQEAKLGDPAATVSPMSTVERTDKAHHRKKFSSRAGSVSRDLGEPQFNAAGRRLFFREAASAESLHSR